MSPLFSPFQLKRLTLPNRIVLPAMAHGKSLGGVLGPEFAEFFRLRAAGGVGLLISDASCVPHPVAPGRFDTTTFHGVHALASFAHILEQVHGAGGRMIVQLHHKGGTRYAADAPNPYLPSVSPSGIAHRPSDAEPMRVEAIGEPLSVGEIEGLIDAYGAAAESAVQLGFDGLEVHGAHGYLIDQFLWPVTNRRSDAYGGTPCNRARFAAEIVAACRRRVGSDFPILFRVSQWKTTSYDACIAETPEELEALLLPISEAGVDLFDCSQRRFWEPTFDHSALNLAGWAKKITGKPSMSVGSVTLKGDFIPQVRSQLANAAIATPVTGSHSQEGAHASENLERLLEMMECGEFDLIGVGRALLANWDWPVLVRERRLSELKAYDSDTLAQATTFAHLSHNKISKYSESGA